MSARGEYLEGVAVGQWTAMWPDGTKQAEGDVIDGSPRGTWKIWAKAEWGQFTVVEGSAHARFEAWYLEGQRLGKGSCEKGKAQPGWLAWERNGQMTATPALASAVDGLCGAFWRFTQTFVSPGELGAQDSR